ncbi:MAG: DUF3800 domain-containing protein [Acidipila sp.]|nr:DUF3800 domain-containing protein [Acidipila sp.]
MIVSYMDESFDMTPGGVFVVGGLLGRGVPLFELERRWEVLRNRSDIGIGYFKASECERGTKQFAKFVVDPRNITGAERLKLDSINQEFLNLITAPVAFDDQPYLCVQGVGVVQKDFYDAIRKRNARAILGNSPYRLAYDLAMIQCAWAMKVLESDVKSEKLKRMDTSSAKDCVSFVCDEDEEHAPLANKAYRNLKQTNPNAAEYMATFSTANDKDCEPLQAADLAAFEVRRALGLSLGLWEGPLRKQFNTLAKKQIMFLITRADKAQLAHIVSTHKPGEPFKLDALMEMQITENIKITI